MSDLNLVCPSCRGPLVDAGKALSCPGCAKSFERDAAGVVDFAEGCYYDSFCADCGIDSEARVGLANEEAGMAGRIEDFYSVLAQNERTRQNALDRPFRILDSGCGNGLAVDLFGALGFEAWGNDVSALRKWQWGQRRFAHRLVVADTRRLPFADASFDMVISSGVLEHIGVEEGRNPRYFVRPRADRDEQRRLFVADLLRVLRPGGRLFLDFPNGAFPIDFWHGESAGAMRFHTPREGFLPKVAEIRSMVSQLGPWRVEPLSPARRLRMKQVGRHWYGTALKWPMKKLLEGMETPPLRFLAGSALNPYLVLQIDRRDKPVAAS